MNKPNFVFLFALALLCLFFFYLKPSEILNSQHKQLLVLPPSDSREVASVTNEKQDEKIQKTTQTWARQIQKSPARMPESHAAAVSPQDLIEFEFNKPQTSWKIWKGMRAAYPGVATSKKLGVVSQFQVFDDKNYQSSLENFSVQEPVVLFEERLKTTGVLTGTFEIQLAPQASWQELENQYSLKLIQSFQELNLFYATANQNRFNLSQLFKDLSQDASVATVNLEILSKQYEQK